MKIIHLILAALLVLFFTSCEELLTDSTASSEISNSNSTDNNIQYGCTDPHSFNYDPNATDNDHSCHSMKGCLGFAPNQNQSGTIGVSLNNPHWDQIMLEEVNIQQQFWGDYNTEFWILYEASADQKNAYADPAGRILFGFYMFYHILETYQSALPVAGVMAHEYAHRVQQNLHYSYEHQEFQELEADAFSGFYMALAKQFAWVDIQTYFANTYASGDYNYNSPGHHGSPEERVAAAYTGVETAIYAINNNYQFSYNELHQLFIDHISNYVAPRSTRVYQEINYPKNMDVSKLSALYPNKNK